MTPHRDVNKVINTLTTGIKDIFGRGLVGIYLTGSLTYADFNPANSDIDLLVVLDNPVTPSQLTSLKKLHNQVALENKKWAKRLECSYIPQNMLQSILPPKTPRPYYGEGIFYPQALYSNEWLINNHLLYKYGITLSGTDFTKLIKPIDIKDVQDACVKDLLEEWKPKINDPTYLNNSHHQAYVILNMCRILYTVMQSEVASKNVSALWVSHKFPHWKSLIKQAQNWHYGKKLNLKKEVRNFIKFVITIVNDYNSKNLQ